MKTSSIFLLLSAAVLLPIQVFSQLLKKGYVITEQQDTLHGFIKEKPDEDLAQYVSFSKVNDPSQLEDFASFRLNGFGFDNGRIFKKFRLKEFDGKDSVQNEYFVKQIVTGKIDAYTIESAGKETQWLLNNRKTGKIVHLKKPTFREEKTADGRLVVASDVKYLHYIALVKQDTPSEFIKQDDFKYSKKQIIKNIRKYNLLYKEQYPVHEYKEQTQITYGLLGGTYVLKNPIFGENEASNALRLSGFRDVAWIEKISRIAFTQGFSYSAFDQSETVYLNRNDTLRLHSRMKVLSMYPVGVKFQGYSGRVMPYIYTGLGITFIKYEHKDFYYAEDFNSPLIGLNVGTGLKMRLTPHWYFLSELSFKFSEGFYVNGGIAYQYTKQHK